MTTKETPETQPVDNWEFFTDGAYWDMCAVRPVGDRDFNSPNLFHVSNLKEGERLASLLNSLTNPQNVEGDLCHYELRVLVRRLAVRLPKDDTVRLQAEDYLRRTFKAADVLRADEHEQLFHPKQEPSGDVKAALDSIPAWNEVESIDDMEVLADWFNEHALTIRAALTAKQQSVNEDIIETPANDALKILRLVNNWSEIETAPKDGTEILLGRFEDGVIEDVIKDYWYEDRVIADWAEYPAVFDKSPTHWAMLPLILDVTAPPTPVTKQQPDVNAELLDACKKTIQDFVRETTHLSAENLGYGVNYNGSHDCRISKATLEQGRSTLKAIARAEQKGGE